MFFRDFFKLLGFLLICVVVTVCAAFAFNYFFEGINFFCNGGYIDGILDLIICVFSIFVGYCAFWIQDEFL